MNEKYRVAWYIDSTYQVLDRETDEQLYQGSLSDCDGMEKMLRSGALPLNLIMMATISTGILTK